MQRAAGGMITVPPSVIMAAISSPTMRGMLYRADRDRLSSPVAAAPLQGGCPTSRLSSTGEICLSPRSRSSMSFTVGGT
jgi:hypothetical protein